jgi:3',5'-cyclic AMP phosphodiesterase CpdA
MVHRLAAAASAALALLSCALPTPQHRELTRPPPAPRDSFVVLGDTQRSLWAEEHVLGREQNDRERVELIDQLVSRENPAFVVHLGDLVAKASPQHWRYFDQLTAPLTDAKIPLLPVLGNHEYFGDGRDPSRSSRRRYRDLANGGYYAKRWGRLGLVWLDTNLEGRAATRQGAWLARTLATLDQAPDIEAIIAFSHHPALTNGIARYGHEGLRRDLLPSLQRSKKALALFSAHVHGYERFALDELTLIVSGGGGGPRVAYRTGRDQSAAPASPDLGDPSPRPFHYVVVRDSGTDLIVTTRCLARSNGCPANGVFDEIRLSPTARAE